MVWRPDSRLFIRLFVACNIVLAIYNFLTFNVVTRNTKPCVIVGYNASLPMQQRLIVVTSTTVEPTTPFASENVSRNVIELQKRGRYYVTTNLVQAQRTYQGNESITLTTQGTLDFLQHVSTLCKRWGGPVSVAVYAPGPELNQALRLIAQLRQCEHLCVRENVTWHMVFDGSDEERPSLVNESVVFNCSGGKLQISSNYRQVTKKTYPINVLRNIARQAAMTRYILASDVELYPSANIIPRFLRMLEVEAKIRKTSPNVYVLPIFEVDKDQEAPETKEQLIPLLDNGKAIYFHKWVCDSCQNFPGRNHWKETISNNNSLSVFVTTNRDRTHSSWEPIYIGTNDEPLYDEKLSWDGKRDKMSQMYEMCLLQYTLLVLDNAFLVHAPGIKQISNADLKRRAPYVRKNNAAYGHTMKELRNKYSNHKNC